MTEKLESEQQQPEKFDPFNVVFCVHCDKLHHAESNTYLKVVGDLYRGEDTDLLEDKDDIDEDIIDEFGIRSYISYILEDDRSGVRLVAIFCDGNKDKPSCLEKYLAECRSLGCD